MSGYFYGKSYDPMNENKLIELYQTNKDVLIRDQLFEEKRQLLEVFTNKLIRTLFPNICLENQDFMSYSYLSFIKCLESFNTKQRRYTFTQALMTINRSMIIRYGGKMLQNGHYALNNSFSLDEIRASYSINCANEIDFHKELDQEIEIEKIRKFLGHFPAASRKIIELKLQGYEVSEISKKLHLSSKFVSNTFAQICRKYQKHCV
jgi:RNA polymerase sigma factor (sigma-70 family)